ncbi:hypothetical protein NDK47_01095 [Brevibacillus ruminantium]|uniref:AAA domain-containing protein n=1 Tax=Brevibacillus ruminantium TaxID=2950604 RepID=A0ABY4WGZ8_9BACL|nr:hypothetical protein [Brevibacillus ruminantium]USG65984.1 hypothetical protein NDK47_01095 [Brevibacillus ruminantium]
MKTIVCYPVKSLVYTYLPSKCQALVSESSTDFFRLAKLYQPEAAVLFSEMFETPVWDWLPKVREALPTETRIIVVPLYQNERLVKEVVEVADLNGVYTLLANLSQEEIRKAIGQIFGWEEEDVERQRIPPERQGLIYALMSHGGAGITSFCINYPVLLAKEYPEKRILVLDMNLHKQDLTRFYKLQQFQLSLFRPDLLDMRTARQRDWGKLCKQSSYCPNLFYANATSNWKSVEISNLMTTLREQFDFVYIDWGYSFPETEALKRLVHIADRNLFFVRSDPFSIEGAKEWIKSWNQRGIDYQVMLSHMEKGQVNRIGEGISVYGVVPRISDDRLSQSHRTHSVLVEEFLPPKPYITGLQAIMQAEKMVRGAVVYQ